MKRHVTLAIYLVSSIVVGTAAAVGFSYASYVYNRRYETPVEFNSGLLSSYFDGGSGTSSDPYTIKTPNHLRALQQLNVLGVFSENTYFKLSDDIPSSGMVWSGDDLLPIGNEDYPFYSQFNGNGKIINNLVVNGSQTNDIGMFGYVAMNSHVEDFLLSAPTIKVTADNNPSALSTTNPFAELFSNPTTGAPSLGLTLTQKVGTTPAYFTPTKSSLVGGGITYQIYYKSTDDSLLSYNSLNNRWVVNTPVDGESGKYYPVQLSARVYGVYESKIISYTLERWHINVTYDGNVNVANTSTSINAGYWKTINAAASEGLGPHKTYVGFFIGHLDGTVDHLGLYGGNASDANANAKLIVQGRPVSSFSSLIGRSLNDNVYDDANASYASRDFDFDYIIDNPTYTPSSSSVFTIPGDPTTSTNTLEYVDTMKSRAIEVSKYYSIQDPTETSYLRFYPGLSNSSTTYQTGELDGLGNPITLTQDAMSLVNEPLSAHVYTNRTWLGRLEKDFFLKNGIWMYLSAETAGGWGAFFSTKETRYEAKIAITYVATGSTANKFQIMYNGWNPDAIGIPSIFEYVAYDQWRNLNTITNDEGLPVYNPNSYPIVQTDTETGSPLTNRLLQYEISFEVNLEKYAFSSDFNLMLGLGVGKELDSTVPNYTLNDTNTHYYSNRQFTYDPFSLNILQLDLMFTSLDGTLSRQIADVDYLYTIPTYAAGEWSDWNKGSETRVYFDVGTGILSPGTSATYRFYRSNAQWWTLSKVYGYHNIPTGSGWELKNTSGYTQAVLAND